MKQPLLTVLFIICAVSTALAQQTIRKSIEANNQKFIETFNKGDAVAVAALYATDARLLPPNSQMIEGRANIQSFWQRLITMGAKVTKLEIAHVETSGNMAVEVGHYALTIPGAGGAISTDEGKYVVVWKRQGRDWKLAVDIFNTSLPVAAPGN